MPGLQKFKAERRKRTEPYQDYYDDESKAFVAEHCWFELSFFGYDFDGGPDPSLRREPPPGLGLLDQWVARANRGRSPNPPPA